VRELGTFTVSELAAELGCSKPVAAKRLNAMMTVVPPMIRPAGRALGKPIFEYLRPHDEGLAFANQQRMRERTTPEQHAVAMAPPLVERNQEVKNSLVESISAKEIRAVVREAIDAGWKLEVGSGKHRLRLVNGGKRVTVVSTPRNPSNAANNLRQQVFGFNARLHQHA
jgi:hypothetical protein